MLGEVIKELRKGIGLTQTELSSMLDVASNTISQWESGERTPKTSMLPKLAEALGCTIQDLFDSKD